MSLSQMSASAAAVLLIGAAMACAGVAPLGPTTPGTGATQPLRVMTYNIHHGAGNDDCVTPAAEPGSPPSAECGLDLERIAGIIHSEAPDVAGLQEVDRFWARSGGVDQAAALGVMLNMQTCYGANLTHGPDAHASVPHEYGTLIVSRHAIRSCGNTLLPRAGNTEQRGLLKATIEAGGGSLDFYNTHLHTQEADRRLQVDAMLRHIGRPSAPVVLVGDLNARPAEAYLAPLFAVLQDAWAIAGTGPGFTSPARPGEPARNRIDYVLVSPGIVVTGAVTRDDAGAAVASDHYPVVARLELPGGR